MISIHSAEENEFIRNYVEEQPLHSQTVWIGLKKEVYGLQELVWVDKSPLNFVNWNSGEPNFEPFIRMWIDSNGKWDDIYDHNLAFVCGFNCKLSIKISK